MARTIAQLDAALRTAASQNKMADITTLVNSMTAAEKQGLSGGTYTVVLNSIARYTLVSDSVATSTVQNFMAKVGSYVSPAAIGNAIVAFSDDMNLPALDAVTDYLTTAQKQNISPNQIGFALYNLSTYVTEDSDATIAAAARDFMTKLGAYAPPADVGTAMAMFSSHWNFAALDAVTDFLTPAQKMNISRQDLGDTIQNIAAYTNSSGPGTANDAQTASALRDFMTKVGTFVHPADIGIVMRGLSLDWNFSALDAVTDYLTTDQKMNISPQDLGRTLLNISQYTLGSGPGTQTDAATATAIRDLMSKLGTYVHPDDIGQAMVTLAQDKNFAALDAVTDYLTTPQKMNFSVTYIGRTLTEIVEHTLGNGPGTATDAVTATAVRDFMSKLGAYASPSDIGASIVVLAQDKNFAALDAATDYLTTAQKQNISVSQLGKVLAEITSYTLGNGPGTATDAATATAVNDFMSKLGAYVSPSDIGSAIAVLAQDKNFAALDAATDYLTAAQKANIGVAQLGKVLAEITEHTLGNGPGTATDAVTTTAVRDFMSKLGAYVFPSDIGSSIVVLAQDKNFAALDAVTDYLTTAQKANIGSANLGRTLTLIAEHTLGTGPGTATDAATASAVRNFMAKLGAYVPPSDIGPAMYVLAQDKNFAALDAVTDYLTAAQKANIGASFLDRTLGEIADHTFGTAPGTATNAVTESVIRDFMAKVGTYASPQAILSASTTLVQDGNYGALDGIMDYASDVQIGAVKSQLASKGITALSNASENVVGTSASDIIFARGGDDTVNGGAGNDRVYGGAGNDRLYGGTGNDVIYGDEGHDNLYGDAGNDVLYGGAGGNSFTGGTGADRFVFDADVGVVDEVLDFKASEGDKLDFSALLDKFDPTTHAISDFIQESTVRGHTVLLVDADGKGSASAPVAVAMLINDNGAVDIKDLYAKGQIIA